MGKKRTITIDDSQKAPTKAKKTIFKWETAYTDLPDHISAILRTKRIKPDQLVTMADGELLAIDGIRDEQVAQIRDKYPADLAPVEATPVKKEVSTPTPEDKPTAHTLSPRLKYPTVLHGRSRRFKAKLTKVEDKTYSLADALPLLRRISYPKHRTIELHLNTKEAGVRGELSLPHTIGKDIKVAIFSDQLATTIKTGKIDFDVLLARPSDMGTVAPLAKILGPKGLMPNPKTGTITDNPEDRAKQLTKGATLAYKTEAKAKIIHLNVGNLNQKDEDILNNLKAIVTGIGITKLTSGYLKSTMSPSIKLDLNSI